ncbi:tRNA (adenosine(37)-N6)-threonylcarbamoyltransferase complex dimerization subunit type 1 TsaB [Bifidobacterium aemilianum]|uniref:tRNA (Adenosine(37)-N6)-threonylcarbamoyltransferase complex dimerization subunit type 1 TsaB n=1 Tax=Bifidobacterium aemilianum TaxID=2493120 RepID=A0A366KA96_9BIFI|nr:tRNA (adenosine(37)-N6)-threonylcarbamoyltransferase complex dimerization subunit type 1 TsaB [Bifidobacterium aemilianum]RBP98152.1 tRNA (adenosine(37)-N6)-threonylcarbamoyltransferase complex dimerization subunit type 1 TsaB [Bifidobacterium aemilianum]
MNTLVIDSSYGSTVGLVGHEPIVETDSRTHVERLQRNIATAVEGAGLEASDLDRIVVGVGPAPFTGLRAGIVAAKALAFACGAELLGQDILAPQAAMTALLRAAGSDKGADTLPQADRDLAGQLSGKEVLSGLLGSAAASGGQQEPIHHVTLAVNDARRKQLYYALYDCPPYDQTSHDAGQAFGVRTLLPMDIDYPSNIASKLLEQLEALTAADGCRCLVDLVGHGAAKYAQDWQVVGEHLGQVIDSSVLDAGAPGLALFAHCAERAEHGRLAKPGQPAQAPVEPLYLRRPDVSVPNPLKRVLGNGQADRLR